MSLIRSKMATGAIWMVAMKMAERGLGLLSTLIFVRVLLPEDFGLVAMAMSIVAVLELMTAFSFDVAIIQRSDVKDDDLNTAWTFNVLFGTATAALMVLLAPLAAEYYREPRLEAVMMVMAAAWFIQSFENIGTVFFRKELEFNREFYFVFFKKVISFSATLPLVLIFDSYWGLVIGMVIGRTGGTVLSYLLHPYRPWFSMRSARRLFGFSSWLLLNNFLRVLNTRLTDFVIGRYVSAGALGTYRVATEIANLPTTEVIAPINRAVLPGYAKFKDDLAKLKMAFLDVFGVTTLIAVPAGLGLAASADALVPTLLGFNWPEAIPLMSILGVYCAIQCISANSGMLFMAAGKLRLLTALSAARITLLAPLLLHFVSERGLIGAANAMLITSSVFAPLTLIFAARVVQLSISEYARRLFRPVLASALMYVSASAVMDRLFGQPESVTEAILALITVVIVGVIVYGTSLGLLWHLQGRPEGAELNVWRKAIELLRSRQRLSPDQSV